MKGISLIRPSSSMAVALVALFVALGGVGYAAATIDSGDIVNNSVRGKDIRNRTIQSKDVRKNGLGGVAIKESALAKVPSAAKADAAASATTATNAAGAANADKLDGVDSSGFMSKRQRIFEQTTSSEIPVFVQNTTQVALAPALAGVPAGDYLVMARLEYDNDDGSGENVECRLGVPGTDDEVSVSLAAGNSPGEHQLVSLQKMVSSASTFSASVSCTSDGSDHVDQLSIIAVGLD